MKTAMRGEKEWTGLTSPAGTAPGPDAAPTSPAPALKRNAYIQYLRGYAALMVVLDHAMLRLAHADARFAHLANYAGDLGAMGVQIFFVISGYIMVAIAHDQFGKPGATGRFWLARLTRIAPLYYIATAIALVMPVWLGGRVFAFPDILKSLLFIATDARPDENALLPILGVGWTLNYEMFFYLLFGLGLLLPRRAGLSLSVGALLLLVVAGQGVKLAGGVEPRTALYFYTHQIMILFAAGMALALWQKSRFFRALRIPAPAAIGVAPALAAILVLNFYMPGRFPLWRTLAMYGLATVPVILCVMAAPRAPRRLAELLGDASFNIYLFHGFALSVTIAAWEWAFGPSLPALRIAACLLIGTLAGLAAYRFLEQPLTRALHSRTGKRRD